MTNEKITATASPKPSYCETNRSWSVFGRYSGCAGIMQQYIFYYERSVRQGRE